MTSSLSPWDASALIGRHPSLSLLGLYERFTAPPQTIPQRSLSSYLEDGLIDWVSRSQNWSQPIKRFHSSSSEAGSAFPATIECRAACWHAADDSGQQITATTAHLAAFNFSREWNKSGTVPQHYADQAQWIMALSGSTLHAFVVLADRAASVFWVERNDDEIAALQAGARDFADRLAKGEAPPLDHVASAPIANASDQASPEQPVDLDALCTNWKAAREANAAAVTAATSAETRLKTATSALKAAIAPGQHHDHQQVRIHHNARTGQLTEEKLDDTYF